MSMSEMSSNAFVKCCKRSLSPAVNAKVIEGTVMTIVFIVAHVLPAEEQFL